MAETSVEATFLRPMAIALGFGIVYATLITLVLLPCVYMVAEDIKQYFVWFFKGNKGENLPDRQAEELKNPSLA